MPRICDQSGTPKAARRHKRKLMSGLHCNHGPRGCTSGLHFPVFWEPSIIKSLKDFLGKSRQHVPFFSNSSFKNRRNGRVYGQSLIPFLVGQIYGQNSRCHVLPPENFNNRIQQSNPFEHSLCKNGQHFRLFSSKISKIKQALSTIESKFFFLGRKGQHFPLFSTPISTF